MASNLTEVNEKRAACLIALKEWHDRDARPLHPEELAVRLGVKTQQDVIQKIADYLTNEGLVEHQGIGYRISHKGIKALEELETDPASPNVHLSEGLKDALIMHGRHNSSGL